MRSLIILGTLLLAPTLVLAQATPTQANTATTTSAATGKTLKDYDRGTEFSTPNASWNISDNKTTITISHQKHYDALVMLKKSWFQGTDAKQIYDARKKSLASYLPGAIFIRENQNITVGGSVTAVSMTYKNPADLKVVREVFFIHKGQAYELVFQAKEATFPTVKDEFGSILNSMKLF